MQDGNFSLVSPLSLPFLHPPNIVKSLFLVKSILWLYINMTIQMLFMAKPCNILIYFSLFITFCFLIKNCLFPFLSHLS